MVFDCVVIGFGMLSKFTFVLVVPIPLPAGKLSPSAFEKPSDTTLVAKFEKSLRNASLLGNKLPKAVSICFWLGLAGNITPCLRMIFTTSFGCWSIVNAVIAYTSFGANCCFISLLRLLLRR